MEKDREDFRKKIRGYSQEGNVLRVYFFHTIKSSSFGGINKLCWMKIFEGLYKFFKFNLIFLRNARRNEFFV